MSTTIKFRRGTAAQWTTANPVLVAGEPGHETDSGKQKIGDGTSTWSELEYFLPESALSATIEAVAPPKSVGPRDLPRVKHGIRPTLLIDQTYPHATFTHRMVSTEGDLWWSFGHDGALRQAFAGGRDWFRTYSAPNTGQMSREGMWLKTADDSLLTTWDPYDGSPASILRSTDGGYTWTVVVASTANIGFLGPTSLCQSPVTGNLYLAEYTTSDLVTTVNIKRSTDEGATWSVWKALPRNTSADAGNTSGVTHVHGIQIDPIDDRVWVCVGDAPPSAGIYRLTTDETDWTAVATNRQLDTANGVWGGAVGLMFFPTHIAWGVDQSFTSGLLRMARTEIGQATPDVEVVVKTNSTCFYTCRTDTTNTEWLMCASQEGGAAAIDNAVHFYRVANNGATVDEVGSFPVHSGTSFAWAWPLGTPLQTRPDRLMWWSTNIHAGDTTGDTEMLGFQFSARVGWGNQSHLRPDVSKVYEQPMTQSSGRIALAGTSEVGFGALIVPSRARRLYVIDLGAKLWDFAGISGTVRITDGAGVTLNNGVGTPMEFATMSMRAGSQNDAASHLFTSGLLTPGSEVHFRVANPYSATAATAFVTYAWGY